MVEGTRVYKVQHAWDVAGQAMPFGVLAKLGHMHNALHTWDNKVLKEPKRRRQKAQRELDKTMTGPMTKDNEQKAKKSANLIEILLEREEVHLLQRSRANGCN
jgi:hypothetical protein